MALNYGSLNSIVSNTETIISTFTTSGAVKLKGFIATGTAPGRYILRTGGLSGTILATFRTSEIERTAYVMFPDQDVATSIQISVSVINERFDGSYDYEATIIYV
jgi:hypothetical protein